MQAIRRRAMRWAVVAAALALAGCQREPDELLFIVGRVVDADRRPVPGVEVTLERNGAEGCSMRGAVGAEFFELGSFSPFASFTSNAAGDYLFEVSERDTRTDSSSVRIGGATACFRLSVPGEQGRTVVDFSHPGADIEVADLPRRRGRASVVVAVGAVEFDGDVSVDLSGFDGTMSGWLIEAGGERAWVLGSADAGASVPQELLEDFPGLAAKHQTLFLHAPESPPLVLHREFSFIGVLESEPLALTMSPLVPLSRGAPCHFAGGDGGVCAYTDGLLEARLLEPAVMTSGGEWRPKADSLTVDLGTSRLVRTVVVRELRGPGEGAGILTETSLDGGEWMPFVPLGHVPPRQADWRRLAMEERRSAALYLWARAEQPRAARYVRLRAVSTSDRPPGWLDFEPLISLSEFSVFE